MTSQAIKTKFQRLRATGLFVFNLQKKTQYGDKELTLELDSVSLAWSYWLYKLFLWSVYLFTPTQYQNNKPHNYVITRKVGIHVPA